MVPIENDYRIVETRENFIDEAQGAPIFACFYTIDNGYKVEADRLIESLENYRLPYYVEGILTGGMDWDAITKRKPIFILKVLDLFPNRDVVWIDADAIILAMPTELFNLNADFSCCYKGKDNEKLHSAVLFYKNNTVARNICQDWIQENRKPKKYRTGDQKHLENVIKRTPDYKPHVLPSSYIKTCVSGVHSYGDGVIGQYYASNTLKNCHLGIFRRALLYYRLKPAWLRRRVQKWFMKLTRYKANIPRFLQ